MQSENLMDIAGRGLRMIVHRFSRRYCGCYLPRVLPARALCVATQLPHCRVPYSSCPLIGFVTDDISSDSDDSDNEPISSKKQTEKDASESEGEVKEEPASDSD